MIFWIRDVSIGEARLVYTNKTRDALVGYYYYFLMIFHAHGKKIKMQET